MPPLYEASHERECLNFSAAEGTLERKSCEEHAHIESQYISLS